MTEHPAIRYGISKVHRAHGHIESVTVRPVNGRTSGSEEDEEKWSRDKVVNRLKKGDRFFTLRKRIGRRVQLGQRVRVWRDIFIRCMPNRNSWRRKGSDKLVWLPLTKLPKF